jgi:hypothetical protein
MVCIRFVDEDTSIPSRRVASAWSAPFNGFTWVSNFRLQLLRGSHQAFRKARGRERVGPADAPSGSFSLSLLGKFMDAIEMLQY